MVTWIATATTIQMVASDIFSAKYFQPELPPDLLTIAVVSLPASCNNYYAPIKYDRSSVMLTLVLGCTFTIPYTCNILL